MKTVSENACFGGVQGVYSHDAPSTRCEMTFGLYLPPQASDGPVPVLWYLSGLTCTHENAMVKAGAQLHAAQHGLAVVFPDTSPRGNGVPDDDAFDLGQGAGFYVNATEVPWAQHFQMWDCITKDLFDLVLSEFPIDGGRQGITGHSMGGHGALTMAMTHPDRFRSLSAFSPITHPGASDWGRKQLGAYLGSDESGWTAHDATALMTKTGYPGEILIDQGDSDQFLEMLKPQDLKQAMSARGQPGSIRMQPGYDHSYFFVSTFMGDHVAHHARQLAK